MVGGLYSGGAAFESETLNLTLPAVLRRNGEKFNMFVEN
jgi:hypothetical protein